MVDRDPRAVLDPLDAYWQFDAVRDLEVAAGVRSSFYFLSERRLLAETPSRSWLRARNWVLYAGRYDLARPNVRRAIADLHRDGWEIGLHGSYTSYLDGDRLRYEKERLEEVVGDVVVGGRQHYLNLRQPDTWRLQRDVGLRYDSSLGSSTDYGFRDGYDVVRPFDDDFVVFPLTLMDNALMHAVDSVEEAIDVCDALLDEARAHGAVMTVDWHQRVFDESEFPGYRTVYEHLLRRALRMDAWVGPCGDLYAWVTSGAAVRR